ncbi:MAG: putative toxin-antitoxin system toxin component, PIN family [Cyanobacteria bacterium J06628_6]
MYVFDTNIFVAGLRSRLGASFLLLQAIGEGRLSGAVSYPLFLEYEDVLKREQNLSNFWASADEVDVVLNVLAARLTPVPIYFRWRPQLSDPDDELVLECAINAGAEAIVTFNQRDFLPQATQFQLDILKPGEVVRKLNLRRSDGA